MIPSLSRLTSLLTCLALVSCAATSPGDPQVRQARSKFESRKTYAQGIIIGAVAGALLGGAVGALSGEQNGFQKGLVAGGIGGAVAGGAYAHHKVGQRRAYAAYEGALDNAIANARSTKQAASEFNDVLTTQLRKSRTDTATLKGTVADANTVLTSVEREIECQNEALNNAVANGVPANDRSRLASEIRGLERERHQLESNINRLTPSGTIDGNMAVSR